MNPFHNHIPVYSLNSFRTSDDRSKLFQVEIFDANRHFQVSYPHRHDFYEMLYLKNGSGIHIIDSNEYRISPPCIFFLSPGQAHKLDLSKDIEGFIFLFTSEFYLFDQKEKNHLLEYPFFFSIDQNNPPLFLSNEDDRKFIEMLFIQGCKEMLSNDFANEAVVRAILNVLLLKCVQLYPHKTKAKYGRGQILVKNFLLHIEENFHKNLKVADYADMLAITPHHLTQIVKQYTGKTSTELLQEKLIVEIKKLLIHSQLSISEIVDLMHFSDQSYLTKFFKKHTSQTPFEYRRSIHESAYSTKD